MSRIGASMRSFLTATAIVGAVAGTFAAASAGSAATVLTVAGNQLVVRTPMSEELRGQLCLPPNVCTVVAYPSASIGSVALQQGAVNLQSAIAATSGKKIVMAYSQGGFVVTMWLNAHAHAASAPSPDDLTFVVFGNPQRGVGGVSTATGGGSTPTDTAYRIIDVSRQYDMESDWPDNPGNLLAVANAVAGYLLIHTDYTDVDINDPNNLVKTVGNTTYVLVPTADLPLLEPLRRLGLHAIADQLQPVLKPIVDSAYDRSGFTPETTPVLPLPPQQGAASATTTERTMTTAVSSATATSRVASAPAAGPTTLTATAPTDYSLTPPTAGSPVPDTTTAEKPTDTTVHSRPADTAVGDESDSTTTHPADTGGPTSSSSSSTTDSGDATTPESAGHGNPESSS